MDLFTILFYALLCFFGFKLVMAILPFLVVCLAVIGACFLYQQYKRNRR